MFTLFIIVFLDLIGFGMIIPVFPFYAERTGVDPASVIFFLGLYSLGQLVGAPIWGAMSDRLGRRPVLLFTLLGNAAASVLLAFADSGLTLALSRIAAGLAAGNVSTAYAYATDVTTDETRPKALGLLGSAFGLGFIAGPALGGLLAGNDAGGDGLVRVAWGAAAMSTPASSHLLGRYSPPRQAPLVFSVKQTAVPAGLLMAGLLGPWLTEPDGFPKIFAATAAFFALAAVVPLVLDEPADVQPVPRQRPAG
jgi:MFS family permease